MKKLASTMLEYELKKAFDPYYEAPIEVWRYFSELCEQAVYEKKEVIEYSGKRANNGYFLIEGAVGLFLWNDTSRICLDLFTEGQFFADEISLSTDKPSDIEITALEKSTVLRISKSNIEELKQTPMGHILFSVGDQHTLIENQKKQIALMTQTAEQRYSRIFEERPELIQRISQKDIAAYLGISTQSLSRIRKSMK